MSFKQVNINEETFCKVQELSKYYGVKMYQLLDTYISFFDENRDIVTADFFQKLEEEAEEKVEKLKYKISRNFETILKKEINRLIGFIKVQDRNFEDFKRELSYKIDKGVDKESHPLFLQYEFVIFILKKILSYHGVKDDKSIYKEIQKYLEEKDLNYFKKAEQKIEAQKLLL